MELGANGPIGTAFGTSAVDRGRGALRSLSAPRRKSAAPLQPADLAARSAHDEITELAEVLGPADDDEAVAGAHDL